MRIGRLNKRVTIRKQTWSKNSMGENKQAWVDYATVWAGVEPLRGQEALLAEKIESLITTRIVIRYRKDIDDSMMVRYNGIDFEIMYIIPPDFNKRELQLMCRERQSYADARTDQ